MISELLVQECGIIAEVWVNEGKTIATGLFDRLVITNDLKFSEILGCAREIKRLVKLKDAQIPCIIEVEY